MLVNETSSEIYKYLIVANFWINNTSYVGGSTCLFFYYYILIDNFDQITHNDCTITRFVYKKMYMGKNCLKIICLHDSLQLSLLNESV